jgi:hypothetical protein
LFLIRHFLERKDVAGDMKMTEVTYQNLIPSPGPIYHSSPSSACSLQLIMPDWHTVFLVNFLSQNVCVSKSEMLEGDDRNFLRHTEHQNDHFGMHMSV